MDYGVLPSALFFLIVPALTTPKFSGLLSLWVGETWCEFVFVEKSGGREGGFDFRRRPSMEVEG